MNKKVCPICKKKYIEKGIYVSPSGYKTEQFIHEYKKSPYSLDNINFIEVISCSRPVKED